MGVLHTLLHGLNINHNSFPGNSIIIPRRKFFSLFPPNYILICINKHPPVAQNNLVCCFPFKFHFQVEAIIIIINTFQHQILELLILDNFKYLIKCNFLLKNAVVNKYFIKNALISKVENDANIMSRICVCGGPV
jgi:hypothetical protein